MLSPRPIYETDADREREDEVLRALLYMKDEYYYTKAEKLSCYDFRMYGSDDQNLIALGEIKIRGNHSFKYPDYMISKAKVLECLAEAEALGVDFGLFVRFTDGLFCTKVKPDCPYPTKMAGRYDRQDAKDREPCIFIPRTDFKLLCRM